MATKLGKNITNFFSPNRAARGPGKNVTSTEKKRLAKKVETVVKEEQQLEVVVPGLESMPEAAKNGVAEKVTEKIETPVHENSVAKEAVERAVESRSQEKIIQSEEKENVVPEVGDEAIPTPVEQSLQTHATTKTTTKKIKQKEDLDDDDYTPEKLKKKKGKKKPKREPKPDPKQPLITQFIRRSRRVPADLKRKQDVDQLKHYLMTANDEKLEHIVMKSTEYKGRGIFAARKMKKGEFVVEYAGDLLTMEEGRDRETEYQRDTDIGCYIYFFSFKGKRYCIDATTESGRYGRLLNHSKQRANCKTRLVEEPEGIPRLIIEVKDDVDEGTELLYDYGDRSQKSLKAHPWLKQ